MNLPCIDGPVAARLAQTALASVARPWPYRPDFTLDSAADLRLPEHRHPLFHTSYDWHSCVHMHWSLARLLRLHPEAVDAGAIRSVFDARFTASGVVGELATFAGPGGVGFERPYGWAWLLALQAELARLCAVEPAARRWGDALAPLAAMLALRLLDHLPRLDWPMRVGTHGSTAFAAVLALDHARTLGHPTLARCIERRARDWFGRDRRYPAAYEPGGEDFLSAGLVEAVLMQAVLDGCDFADWWQAFEPAPEALARWLAPVRVSDAADARIVHLHGLNLSRAWCWRQLLPALPQDLQPGVAAAIAAHWQASAASAWSGDYVGTHWLASFALLAVSASPLPAPGVAGFG